MQRQRYNSIKLMRVVSGLLACGASAASLAAEERAFDLEEIVVTAQKRSQALNEVPISVTAIDADSINASGATSLEDLQFTVPGLSLVNFYAGGQQYQLRGLSSNQGLPTVGIYVDEMPINSDTANSNLEFDLRDLERVEVLRGPQGTLYGEGSMGGTIKYVTARPKLNGMEGSVGAELASVTDGSALWRIDGMVNAPLIDDTLGVRLVASYADAGGWIDGPAIGGSDVNSGKRVNVRGTVLWKPSDATSVSLMYTHGDVKVDNGTFSIENRRSNASIASPIEDRYSLANLVISHDFGNVEILSSTGFIDRTNSSQFDFSSFFLPLFTAPPPFGFGIPPGVFTGVGYTTETEFQTFTQEIRLSSKREGPLRWTVGGYYRDHEQSSVGTTFEEPVPIGFTLIAADIVNRSKAWALFGEATYAFTPRIEATLGARYYQDNREQDSVSTTFGFGATDTNEDTFSSTNPRLALLYKFDSGSSLYASAAKGFRSGGFNLQSSGAGQPVPPSYSPETLWSYEVGGVMTPAAGRVLLQWAVYYNDWTDVQTFASLPGVPVAVVVNGGKASGPGVDLQATWRPTDALELSVSAGWNDMEYKTTTADKQSGDPIDFVSPLTGALSATYRFPIGSMPAYVRGEAQYTDSFDVNLRYLLPAPAQSEARTIARLSLGVESGSWDAQLYVDNLLDEDRIAMPAYGSLSEPVRTMPRTIGVRATRRF